MASSGKRARPGGGVTPFGSTSRLVACPVCGKQVHLLLATSHVESHFGAVEGEVTTEAGPADAPQPSEAGNGAEQPSAPPSAEDANAAAERAEGDTSCGGAGGASAREEEEDDESAEYGGALAPAPPAPDGQAPSYVPGTDAVWVPFKLQVMSGDYRSCGICMERFEPGVRDRFLLLPCQHARQCGACALRLWLQPKARRRCPWCKGKLDIRPRAFRPFL